MRILLVPCFAHEGQIQIFAGYLSSEKGVWWLSWWDGKRMFGDFYVFGIPNQSRAGSDNGQGSHTLSKNVRIALQGKRNTLPGQTKHNDCIKLSVDRAVMAFAQENSILSSSLFNSRCLKLCTKLKLSQAATFQSITTSWLVIQYRRCLQRFKGFEWLGLTSLTVILFALLPVVTVLLYADAWPKVVA